MEIYLKYAFPKIIIIQIFSYQTYVLSVYNEFFYATKYVFLQTLINIKAPFLVSSVSIFILNKEYYELSKFEISRFYCLLVLNRVPSPGSS